MEAFDSDGESDATLLPSPNIPDAASVFAFVFLVWLLMIAAPVSVFVGALLFPKAALPPLVAYVIWLAVDWRAPIDGGWDKCHVLGNESHGWNIWHHFRSYFSASLVKSVHLPADRNYIFGGHPHGHFPGIRVSTATLPINFYLPREALKSVLEDRVNHSESTRNRLARPEIKTKTTKETSRALYVAIGGPKNSFSWNQDNGLGPPETKRIHSPCLTTGASLVPVLTFGETDYVNRVDTPFTRALSNCTQRLAKFAVPVMEGRWGTLFPRRARLVTVVGEPLHLDQVVENPTLEEVDALHKRYLESLQALYDKHKDEYFEHRVRDMTFAA
ncbi:hypothetical protein BCR33DRAFT_711901 [Rhizoclosmatium globosum]|uniref:Diacylglycerol O-acyltransferase n=1 Tax=Rhizoclosmatium globosum TaxID=329046 RepID=A0A1Y2D036_9FUNG|nr:hypothetical protein BCR33DRAFT_711901 [Rhizoclosmatium globosum]|eukprot:ORY52641.1 hypothetical protein BCR33DRAFT_711901 [Rhizoclosmatium globosum]